MPKKTQRKSLSKKTRFEVFKRDGFVCQYCGAHPPTAILHIDHIKPVADGGTNHQDNLITACESCNLGKGARSLNEIPQSLKDKAIEIAEREAQIEGYNKILAEKAERVESQAWVVAAALCGKKHVDSFDRANFISIKRFIDRLPLPEIIDSADIALARFPHHESARFKYFCGVCWNKVRNEGENNG